MCIEVFICDDAPADLARYERALQSVAQKNSLEVRFHRFPSGLALYEAINRSYVQPDLIFLDILMKDLNGIETGARLRKMGCEALLIYLTSSSDYMHASFDTRPFHYVLKDESCLKNLERAFLSAAARLATRQEKCSPVNTQDGLRLVPYSTITYVESYDHWLYLHAQGLPALSQYAALRDFISQASLSGRIFIRTHRSYVVNSGFISCLSAGAVVLTTGVSIPIGPKYASSVRRTVLDYMRGAGLDL